MSCGSWWLGADAGDRHELTTKRTKRVEAREEGTTQHVACRKSDQTSFVFGGTGKRQTLRLSAPGMEGTAALIARIRAPGKGIASEQQGIARHALPGAGQGRESLPIHQATVAMSRRSQGICGGARGRRRHGAGRRSWTRCKALRGVSFVTAVGLVVEGGDIRRSNRWLTRPPVTDATESSDASRNASRIHFHEPGTRAPVGGVRGPGGPRTYEVTNLSWFLFAFVAKTRR